MPRISRLAAAEPAILAFFRGQAPSVYQYRELATLIGRESASWKIALNTTTRNIINLLIDRGVLRSLHLSPVHGGARLTRYASGDPSPYLVAQSFQRGCYLTHATAVFLRGLTDQVPRAIYLNREQSEKRGATGRLTQPGIDRAFARPQRASRLVYRYGEFTIMVLSGKFTGRLEVGPIRGPGSESLETTSLERTLVDIAVRPAYAGGVHHALSAYQAARTQGASVKLIIETLAALDYSYPYHQAIGYYLSRAGFDDHLLEPLRRLPMQFDFYLTHQIGLDREYVREWKLFVPKGF